MKKIILLTSLCSILFLPALILGNCTAVRGVPYNINAGPIIDGTPVANYTGTVVTIANADSVIVPGKYTYTLQDEGQHDFHLTFNEAGTFTIGIYDIIDGTTIAYITIDVIEPTPTSTPTLTATPTATVPVYRFNLQAYGKNKENGITGSYGIRIDNYSNVPVAIADLKIVSFIMADNGRTSQDLRWQDYSDVWVYDSDGTGTKLTGTFAASFDNISMESCGAVDGMDRSANVQINMMYNGYESIPVGGHIESKEGGNIGWWYYGDMGVINQSNDYSSMIDTRLSDFPGLRINYKYISLYFNTNGTWQHICESLNSSGLIDQDSGQLPCRISACYINTATFTPTQTLTETVFATNTFTVTPGATFTNTHSATETVIVSLTMTSTATSTRTALSTPTPRPGGTALQMYILNNSVQNVMRFDLSGNYLGTWGSFGPGGENGNFNSPYGMAADAEGNIYITDYYSNTVQKFACDGTYLYSIGSFGIQPGHLDGPLGIAVDGEGNIYVADYGNNRVQVFDQNGSLLTVISSYGTAGSSIINPTDMAVDSDGNLYIVDANNNLHKYQRTGVGYEFSWAATWENAADTPYGITVDSANNIYITGLNETVIKKYFVDSGNNLISEGNILLGETGYMGIAVTTESDGNEYLHTVNIINGAIKKFGLDNTNTPVIIRAGSSSYTDGPADIAFAYCSSLPETTPTEVHIETITPTPTATVTTGESYTATVTLTPEVFVTETPTIVSGQCLVLEDSFGNNGIANRDNALGTYDVGRGLTKDSTGNIYVIGITADALNWGGSDIIIWKYNSNGILDANFGSMQGYAGYVIYHNEYQDWSEAILSMLADDEYIYGAGYTEKEMVSGGIKGNFAIWKYHANGALDTTFGNDAGKYLYPDNYMSTAYSIKESHDGDLLIAGETNGITVIKLSKTGQLISSFGTGGAYIFNVSSSARKIKVDDSGNIFVAGRVYIQGNNEAILLKLSPDGVLDTGFGNGGAVIYSSEGFDIIYDITLDSAGNIYVAGETYNNGSQAALILKYDPYGNLVNSFGNGGKFIFTGGGGYDGGYSLGINDSCGKLYVALNSSNYYSVLRVDSKSGTLEAASSLYASSYELLMNENDNTFFVAGALPTNGINMVLWKYKDLCGGCDVQTVTSTFTVTATMTQTVTETPTITSTTTMTVTPSITETPTPICDEIRIASPKVNMKVYISQLSNQAQNFGIKIYNYEPTVLNLSDFTIKTWLHESNDENLASFTSGGTGWINSGGGSDQTANGFSGNISKGYLAVPCVLDVAHKANQYIKFGFSGSIQIPEDGGYFYTQTDTFKFGRSNPSMDNNNWSDDYSRESTGAWIDSPYYAIYYKDVLVYETLDSEGTSDSVTGVPPCTALCEVTQTTTASETPTHTSTPTYSPTFTATITETETSIYTITETQTASVTQTSTQTATPSDTKTITHTITQTDTFTFTATRTITPTITDTLTVTPSITPTDSPTPTTTDTITTTSTETISPTETPTLTPIPTETLTMTVLATLTVTPTVSNIDLTLQFKTSHTDSSTNSPHPQFRLYNNSTTSVSLDRITIRYWYTFEGTTQSENTALDYAGKLPAGTNIQSSTSLSITQGTFSDQNRYLQVSFSSGAGSLSHNEYVEIQTRFNKSDWSNYTQTNDWSFSDYTSFTNRTNVTVYVDGIKVWGFEPGQVQSSGLNNLTSRAQPLSENNVYNYPNPFKDYTNIRFSLDEQADTFIRIYDIKGCKIWSAALKSTSVYKGINILTWDGMHSDGWPASNGVYVLEIQAGSTTIKKKIVRIR